MIMAHKPRELDVPHWARRAVTNARLSHNLPNIVTDRMIYARLLAIPDGTSEGDQSEAFQDLRRDAEHWYERDQD